MSRHTRSCAVAALTALAFTACTDTPTGTGAPIAPSDHAAPSAVKFWDVNASANWNERATSLAARSQLARAPVNVARLYAYLSLAQLRAAEAADASDDSHPPTSVAIGAASAAILAAFFPAFATEIQDALAAQEAAQPWPGAKHADVAAGDAIGRAVASRVLAYSAGDRMGLTNPGTPPLTVGHWLWTGGRIARGSLGARPFIQSSTSELRPAAPPTFGEPEYLAALAEVRHIVDTRTAEQRAIALYWDASQSPASDAPMNNLAVELIRTHRRSDHEAARILFLMNAAAWDALIGCFDAKYTYWFIRPPQADPGIIPNLLFPLPPHPSYPSAHSCVSGSSAAVLADAFPSERDRVAQLADEASLSRLYAGIHYRFDMVAGLALGRAAAAKAIAADLDAIPVH